MTGFFGKIGKSFRLIILVGLLAVAAPIVLTLVHTGKAIT